MPQGSSAPEVAAVNTMSGQRVNEVAAVGVADVGVAAADRHG
jgi:hypothetical protein